MVEPDEYALVDIPTNASSKHSVAEHGEVVFQSADALTPQAVAGVQNVYEFRDGNVYLIASDAEQVLGIDNSGDDIFISTSRELVPEDSNAAEQNWYDARVNGGFVRAPSLECEGEGCGLPVATVPALPETASATVEGEPPLSSSRETAAPKAAPSRKRNRHGQRCVASRRTRRQRPKKCVTGARRAQHERSSLGRPSVRRSGRAR